MAELLIEKDIDTYTKLMSLLSRISSNINIAENLRNYASNLSRPEFFYMKGTEKFIVIYFLAMVVQKSIY